MPYVLEQYRINYTPNLIHARLYMCGCIFYFFYATIEFKTR